MSLSHIETGLKVNRETAIKMASEVFYTQKRTTEVHLRTFNRLVVLSYKGCRKDEQLIRGSVVVVRVVKMENREVMK